MPTAVPIATGIRSLLYGSISDSIAGAYTSLRSSKQKPMENDLIFLSLLLHIYQAALDVHRSCQGLQPQLGPLPGQSLADNKGLKGEEGKGDESGSYFDTLALREDKSWNLEQLMQETIALGTSLLLLQSH